MLGLNLTLSLSRQAMMQSQQHRVVRLSRDELAQWCDELIRVCHQQEHLIMELQKVAANLMVLHALKDAPPLGEPSADHYQWARELLGQ